MKVSLIVAVGKNREIGLQNKIPWKCSEDLKFFKKTTWGHHLLMGRKTFESLGRPLPGRKSIILTKNRDYQKEGILVAHDFAEAIGVAKKAGEDELMVCGGASIYQASLPYADRIYLSTIDYQGEADTFFPEIDLGKWNQVYRRDHDGTLPWSIQILEK